MKTKDTALVILLASIAVVMLGLQMVFHLEIQRAVLVLISMGTSIYVWIRFRRALRPWPGRILLGLGTLLLALACGWSGANIVRSNLYNAAVDGHEPYSTWYEIVCTTQVVLQWSAAVLAVAFVVGSAILPFWIRLQPTQAKQP